jgi:DNA-binding FadR family transcriptional regulator
MREAVEIMGTALDNVDLFVEADLDFHLALAEGTQNPLIPILMDSIIDLLREQRKRIGLTKGGLQRGQAHHKKILDAITPNPQAGARRCKIICNRYEKIQRPLPQTRTEAYFLEDCTWQNWDMSGLA